MMRNGQQNLTSKTARPSPRNGVALPIGNHPGNTGGKPGRSGRPTKAFKAFIAELRSNPDVQAAIERAAKDENSRNFRAALDVIVRYDTDAPERDPLAGLTKEQLTERIVNILKVAAQRRREAMRNTKTG